MSGYMTSRAPGMAFAVAMPPDGVTSGSTRPWITKVGAVTEPRARVRSGLAAIAMVWRAVPAGVVAALERGSCDLPSGSSVEVRTGDQFHDLDAIVEGDLGVTGEQPRHLSQERQADPAVLAVARVRHDRREGRNTVRVADGDGLADHPAHGDADDVGPADVEVVEQRDGVVSHVVERVRGVGQSPRGDTERSPAGGWARGRRSSSRDRRRGCRSGSPGSHVHEALDELQRPCDELAAEAHDQQEGSASASPWTSYSRVMPFTLAAVMRRSLRVRERGKVVR